MQASHPEKTEGRAWIKASTGRQPSSRKTVKQSTRDNRKGEETNEKRCKRRARTHPRDGSLSVSNPARVLDTLLGYHWKGKWKRLERGGALKNTSKREAPAQNRYKPNEIRIKEKTVRGKITLWRKPKVPQNAKGTQRHNNLLNTKIEAKRGETRVKTRTRGSYKNLRRAKLKLENGAPNWTPQT